MRDDNVALAAVEALGRIGGHAALDCLLGLAEGRNFFPHFSDYRRARRSGRCTRAAHPTQLAGDRCTASRRSRTRPARRPDGGFTTGRSAQPGQREPRALDRSGVDAIHEHSLRRFGTGIAVERGWPIHHGSPSCGAN